MLRPCVPTVRALRGLQTSHPHPDPHLEPIKKTQCSHSYARGPAAGSSGKGGQEKEAENSFPSMLQTFRSGSRGREQRLGVEGRVGFLRPSALGYECQEWISTPLLHIFHLCPTSQTVLSSPRKRRLLLITVSNPWRYTLSQEAILSGLFQS